MGAQHSTLQILTIVQAIVKIIIFYNHFLASKIHSFPFSSLKFPTVIFNSEYKTWAYNYFHFFYFFFGGGEEGANMFLENGLFVRR